METISIIDVVHGLIERAYEIGASDIHIDLTEKEIDVRFRVDGLLTTSHTFPKSIHEEIIARIKILAGLRSDIHHGAQDGRFKAVVAGGETLDIRLSIMPTYYGENAVMRILAQKIEPASLFDLGMNDTHIELVSNAIKKPHGMILATGPTGSGKTTTLYTLLKMFEAHKQLLVTLEDPIEYSIPYTRQIQINPATGLTFAHGLRAVLRQDPDIIMVGEIRDAETARIAVNTALTGHILLSTLHTSDTSAALLRLVDMKAEAYLVASTIELIIAQRLVRKVCLRCEGCGCPYCFQSGCKGRTGIYEIMHIDNEIRDAIMTGASAREIRTIAVKNGMQTMKEHAEEKIAEGIIRREELIRTLNE